MYGLRYLFVDMNSFFASVEQQDRAELRNQPIAVVAVLTDNTCCIAASYEAKAYGVKTGTMVRDARKMCPSITFVEARVKRYVQYHHKIIEAIESCLHIDKVCSIDEMYGKLMGQEREPKNAAALAFKVKDTIKEKIGEWMRCSIGISSNIWLSKVASDLNKPDGMTMIQPHQMPDAIYTLALTDLPGIASNMQRRLHSAGITNIVELCQASQETLSKAWGGKALGELWWQQLRGIDIPYKPTKRRTVSHSHVLAPQWRNEEKSKAAAMKMLHKAAARMRQLGYQARFISLSLKFTNQQKWHRKQDLGLCRDTLTMARALNSIWGKKPNGAIIKVGITLSGLVSDSSATLPLYQEQSRLNELSDTMDKIDSKYGKHSIYLASMQGAQESAPTRIAFTQIPGMEEF